MIPDEVVEQVQAAADIVAIIGEHVRLKKTGSAFRGPCPFHQGTGPNFSVLPRGGYMCFVCHEKGSVFTFVQKRLGMTFVEAVKYVGEKSGVEVREVQRNREGPDPREPLWELNTTAAQWFRERLWESDQGKVAREYLVKRSVSRETADRFGLGFAPNEIGLLRGYLNGLGFSDERQLEVGLLSRREEQDEPRPRFRDRLMFPILDSTGHAVGFGGRAIGNAEPKYMNSPESPVFSKSRVLFNYSAARHAIRKNERVILVEGYFDVVRMVEAGIEEVIAPMGTALTDEQADLLARSASTVFLLYDSDKPGQKASFKAADILLGRGLTVRMVTLPEGEDPDTFVARQGGAAMEKLLEQAMDVFDRKVQLLERGGWFADLQRKRRALDLLLPTIRATTDAITRDLYLTRTATAAGVAKDVIARELELVPRGRGMRDVGRGTSRGGKTRDAGDQRGTTQRDHRDGGGTPTDGDATPYVEVSPDSSAERELIRVMLLHPDQVDRIIEEVSRVDADAGAELATDETEAEGGPSGLMRDPVYAQIFHAIASAGSSDPEAIFDHLNEIEHHVVEQLRAEPGAIVDPGRTITDSIRMLRARGLREKIENNEGQLRLAGAEERPVLEKRGEALRREWAAVGSRDWRSVRRQQV